jgi:hypothetical protein
MVDYTEVISFLNLHSMNQDEAIELLQEQLYSNNYTFMENVIEEYVLGLDETELATLIKTIRTANQSEG